MLADKTNRKASADLANALAFVGAIENSPARLQRSITLSEQLLEANPKQINVRTDLAFAREYLGRAKFAAGDTAGAMEEYLRSREMSHSISEQSPGDVTSRVQTIATQRATSDALASVGEEGKALDSARQAAEMARKNDVTLPARMKPVTLSCVGDTFRDARDVTSACSAWREAEPFEKNPARLETLQAKLATCH